MGILARWLRFGLIFCSLLDDASREFQEAIDLDPLNLLHNHMLGEIYAWTDRHEEAIAHFQAMLELEPRPGARAEANYRLAEIYVSLGKRERAVGHLVTAVADAPSNPWGKKSEEYLKLLR